MYSVVNCPVIIESLKREVIAMEICKHKSSGKYFIYIDDVGRDKALFVTPEREIKPYKLDSFEEAEDWPESDLIANGLITKGQMKNCMSTEAIDLKNSLKISMNGQSTNKKRSLSS
jgi:hypothetical protein